MMNILTNKKFWIFILFGIFSFSIKAQCNGVWEQVVFESFEYTTQIPGVVPGSIYHNVPQTHAAGIRTGNRHFYLNFVNGYAGPAYDNSFNVCIGSVTRVSFWFKDTWGASNNFDVNIYDGNNVLLQNQNYNIPNNNTWNQFVSNEFNMTTGSIRVEIVNNLINGGGNDLSIDDLALEVCSESEPQVDEFQCESNSNINLKDFILAAPAGGSWNGPSGTSNGDLGTVLLNSTSFGLYTYTIGGLAPCPSESYPVNLIEENGVDAGNDASAFYCSAGIGSDLFDLLGTTDQSGDWIGPGPLANAYQGTFNPNSGVVGEYEYVVLSSNNCPNDTAKVNVQMVSTNVNIGNDTTICQGESVTLDAGVGYEFYLWNTTETSQTIDASTAGEYSVQVGSLGGNLVQNGDFEMGDTGFNSDYTVGAGGAWGQLSNPATYAVNTSASNVHNNFPPCTDHTSGAGNYLIVNGADVANTNTWCQTINVQPNTDYQFSAWINSVSPDNPADLQFSIDGAVQGGIFNAPAITCDWAQYFSIWNSGASTSITICILNQSIFQGGNDYGIDDISFRPICLDQDTMELMIQIPPTVDLGGNQSICETDQVILDAGNPGLTYLWQDNSVGQTLQTNLPGPYSVLVTDGFDCSTTDQMNLSVELLPNSGSDNNEIICESQSTLDMNILIEAGFNIGTWVISQGTPDIDILTGVVQLNGAEQFQIGNINTGVVCPNDTAFYSIQVEEQGFAGLNNSMNVCNSDVILDLNQQLSVGVSGGIWTEITTSNQFTAASGQFTTNGLSGGDYVFEYEVNSNLPCVNSIAEITVHVVENPLPNFTAIDRIGCEDHLVQFSYLPSNTGAFTCHWDFGDNSEVEGCGDVSHLYTEPGLFDVSLTITNEGLCTEVFSVSDYIEVLAMPNAFFTYGPDHIFSSEPEVTFHNGSSNASNFVWDFGDNSATSTDENPIHSYPELIAGTYNVELVSSNYLGCADTFMLTVTVVDEIIFYVPNSFTPDDDNYNPMFLPIMTSGFQVDSYQMEIYNRWGELIFTSNDINDGWDGTYKGKLVQDGTYVWNLRFKEQFNDKKHEHSGHVTLLR